MKRHDGTLLAWLGRGVDGHRLMMVAFWVLVIAGVVLAVRSATGRGGWSRQDAPEAPLDILRRRYASGELTKEQFETMKRDVA